MSSFQMKLVLYFSQCILTTHSTWRHQHLLECHQLPLTACACSLLECPVCAQATTATCSSHYWAFLIPVVRQAFLHLLVHSKEPLTHPAAVPHYFHMCEFPPSGIARSAWCSAQCWEFLILSSTSTCGASQVTSK